MFAVMMITTATIQITVISVHKKRYEKASEIVVWFDLLHIFISRIVKKEDSRSSDFNISWELWKSFSSDTKRQIRVVGNL